MTDIEPLADFDAREGAYPEPPPDWTRYQVVDAALRARRDLGDIEQWTTGEQTATGPALAAWFVKLLDIWVQADALPPRQAAIIRLRFLEAHPCAGSGSFAGHGITTSVCIHCPNPKRYHNDGRYHRYRVDRQGCIVAHNREWTIDDVARALHLSKRTVSEEIRAAMHTIQSHIWPPPPPADDDTTEDVA